MSVFTKVSKKVQNMCKIFEGVEAHAILITRAENSGMKEAEVDRLHSILLQGRISLEQAEKIVETAEMGKNINELLNDADSL